MSAASPPPTNPPAAPLPADHPHHGKTPAELAALEVEDNALYRGLKSFWARLKSGRLVPSKVMAVVILVVVAGGLWWWFSGQSRKATSHRWTGLQNLSADAELNAFATENPDTTVALTARRSRALNLLSVEGTALLRTTDQDTRMKAVDNIQTARDELATLAELFKKDRTLKAACLEDAATAERALVGVPKPGALLANEDPANSRGSVAKAVEFYKQAAAAIGADTPSGQRFTKEAADLEANAKQILATNSFLYSRVAAGDVLKPVTKAEVQPETKPTPTPDGKTPSTKPSPKTPTTKRN